MGTATVTVAVVGTGFASGQVNEQFSWANTTASEQVTSQTLNGGANTITVPTLVNQAIGVVIIPPSTNTQTLTLKGVTGDTGVPISRTNPTTIPFDSASPPANFCLTAGGTVTGCLFRWI